jgi:hypothetical protein
MMKRRQSQLPKLQQQLLNQLQLPIRRRAAPTRMTHQMRKRSPRNLQPRKLHLQQPRKRRAATTMTAATRRKRSRQPKKLPPRRQSRRTIAAARRIPLTMKMKSLQRKPHLLKRKVA